MFENFTAFYFFSHLCENLIKILISIHFSIGYFKNVANYIPRILQTLCCLENIKLSNCLQNKSFQQPNNSERKFFDFLAPPNQQDYNMKTEIQIPSHCHISTQHTRLHFACIQLYCRYTLLLFYQAILKVLLMSPLFVAAYFGLMAKQLWVI